LAEALMTAHELTLRQPVEIDGTTYDKLIVADYSAIAEFECHNPPRVILSLAKTFGVPRKVIRHLDPSDSERAGNLVRNLLDEAVRSFR
jgi:hypothetical protein